MLDFPLANMHRNFNFTLFIASFSLQQMTCVTLGEKGRMEGGENNIKEATTLATTFL